MEAFYGCESLTGAMLPPHVTTVSSGAFKNCGTLEEAAIPASVGKLSEGAFEGTKVRNLYLSDMSTFWQFIYPDETFRFENLYLNGDPVTSLVIPDTFTQIEDGAFSGWESIVSVVIPDTVLSIGSSAFSGCSGLTEMVIPDSVTTIGGSAFSECSSMKRAFIGKGVSEIGRSAFSNCGSLTELTVDEENPTFDSRNNCSAVIETASNKLVHGCGSTHIPKTVTVIGRNAFDTCTSLKSIVIPDSVVEIETDAFLFCANLRQITFPASVQSVGEDAFLGCANLKSYAVENSAMTIGRRAFGYYTYYESWWEGNTLHIELREDVYSGITVYGFMNSTAHLYAVNNQMTFALWDRRPEDSTEPPTEPPTITYILGDADGDGTVTILDATQIQKKLASLPITPAFNERAAEVDRDGSISILDATQIQKHLAHLPSNEAIGTLITETV